jgi:hypothetical protein
MAIDFGTSDFANIRNGDVEIYVADAGTLPEIIDFPAPNTLYHRLGPPFGITEWIDLSSDYTKLGIRGDKTELTREPVVYNVNTNGGVIQTELGSEMMASFSLLETGLEQRQEAIRLGQNRVPVDVVMCVENPGIGDSIEYFANVYLTLTANHSKTLDEAESLLFSIYSKRRRQDSTAGFAFIIEDPTGP